MPAVRLKDIAHDLGVSAVTVSKVLRDHPDIGEATKKRVLERVKELQYRPNLMARGLVTGRTLLVALVVPDLVHTFFAEIAMAASPTLRRAGYSMLIAWTAEDPEMQLSEIGHLLSLGIDAIIVATAGNDLESFRMMEARGVPYVLLDRQVPEFKAPFVGADDLLAGQLATGHLAEIGCKRIAHIRGPRTSPGDLRLEGYKRALQNAGLPFRENYVSSLAVPGSFQHGFEATERLLAIKPRIDGLFCFNDSLALGAIEAVRAAGLRIPEDVAIVGCGNHALAGSLRQPLSTIDQDTQTLGEKSAEAILALLRKPGKNSSTRQIILKPRLIVRATSARPPGKTRKGATRGPRASL